MILILQWWQSPKPQRPVNKMNLLPQFFMAFPFQCWFFITFVFLWFFFLILFGVSGWCKLLIYLLCNQLRNRPWFSERDKIGYWPYSYMYIWWTVYDQAEQGKLKGQVHNFQRPFYNSSQVCAYMYIETRISYCNHSTLHWREAFLMQFQCIFQRQWAYSNIKREFHTIRLVKYTFLI